MLIDLPWHLFTALDIVAWLLIHLGVAYAVTRTDEERFSRQHWLFRPRSWELQGRLYRRLFAIHRWKRHLPDGAALFKQGFRKKRLISKNPDYLRRFRRETCRAETAHWLMMSFAPLFFLWNPPAAAWLNLAYGVLANLPFILTQRHNRYRLTAMLREA